MVGGRFGMATVAMALMAAVMAGPAHAQTKLVKPASGFPIRVTKSGSYFLGSNMVAAAILPDVIKITASNVTINLNGFSIVGPGSGTGIGINAAGMTNVTILNGTVTEMGGAGISLGDNGTVQNVRVIGNGTGGSGGNGIDCGNACVVSGCVVANNANGAGLNLTNATSGYLNTIINGNQSTVAAGTNMGGNVCNGAGC